MVSLKANEKVLCLSYYNIMKYGKFSQKKYCWALLKFKLDLRIISARIWNILTASRCFNPLSANEEYTPHDTVVASGSCNSGQIVKKIDIGKSLKNCITKSNLLYIFEKIKRPKKALTLALADLMWNSIC